MTDDRGVVPTLLETERLVVRRFHAGDVDAIHAYRNDPDVARHQGWETPWPFDEAVMLVAEMALRDPLFERGEWAQLAIERKDEPGLIGDIGVLWQAQDDVAEIGFTLHRGAWGHGYMTEALGAAVAEIAHEMGLRLVAAVTQLDNTRARSVLEMVGFVPVALDGDDEVVYAWKPQGWSR